MCAFAYGLRHSRLDMRPLKLTASLMESAVSQDCALAFPSSQSAPPPAVSELFRGAALQKRHSRAYRQRDGGMFLVKVDPLLNALRSDPHTDEPHPHVHMVVKAVSEQGVHLNIRKATLREWRREFARHLRAHAVDANATERAVRGNTVVSKLDGLYRAEQRHELLKGDFRVEKGNARLLETRKEVERGWFAVSDILMAEGNRELAKQVWRFAITMQPPMTDREAIAEDLRRQVPEAKTQGHAVHPPTSR